MSLAEAEYKDSHLSVLPPKSSASPTSTRTTSLVWTFFSAQLLSSLEHNRGHSLLVPALLIHSPPPSLAHPNLHRHTRRNITSLSTLDNQDFLPLPYFPDSCFFCLPPSPQYSAKARVICRSREHELVKSQPAPVLRTLFGGPKIPRRPH